MKLVEVYRDKVSGIARYVDLDELYDFAIEPVYVAKESNPMELEKHFKVSALTRSNNTNVVLFTDLSSDKSDKVQQWFNSNILGKNK